MAALALSDEQSPLTPAHVGSAQPEDFAAAQTGEQHRVDHRPIPIRSQRPNERDDFTSVKDLRQMPDRPHERHDASITRHRGTHRHAALDRVVIPSPRAPRDASRTPTATTTDDGSSTTPTRRHRHVQGHDADAADHRQRVSDTQRSGCTRLARRLAEEGRLADPWTVETATDMLYALISNDMMERLVADCDWEETQLAEHLSAMFQKTFTA